MICTSDLGFLILPFLLILEEVYCTPVLLGQCVSPMLFQIRSNAETLAGDKVTLSNMGQGFERIERSKNREPLCGSPKKYVPSILPKNLVCPSE